LVVVVLLLKTIYVQSIIQYIFQDEEIVKNYLQHLKRNEYERTKDKFLPAQPIRNVLDQIKASKVYTVLKKLPKGEKGGNKTIVRREGELILFIYITSY
jgi:hypothetical protein